MSPVRTHVGSNNSLELLDIIMCFQPFSNKLRLSGVLTG